MSGAVPILMYHQLSPRVAPSFRKYIVTPRAFNAQMDWLARGGFTTITLDALLDARAGAGQLPPRPVVLTFDDGMRECVDFAVPILRERGFTAIFYLVAGLVGETSRWLVAERGVEYPLADWAAARELVAAGFECGAHSMSHPRLAQLAPEQCREELRRSRELLERELGREVRHLAYPFGSHDETVRALAAEAGYRSACSVRIGLSETADDPLALHRVPVNGDEGMLNFVCRLRTAHPARELARRSARSLLRRLTRASD